MIKIFFTLIFLISILFTKYVNAQSPNIWICAVTSSYVNDTKITGIPENNDVLQLIIVSDGALVIVQKTGNSYKFSDIFESWYGLQVKGASISDYQVTALGFSAGSGGVGTLSFSMTGPHHQWGVRAKCTKTE